MDLSTDVRARCIFIEISPPYPFRNVVLMACDRARGVGQRGEMLGWLRKTAGV